MIARRRFAMAVVMVLALGAAGCGREKPAKPAPPVTPATRADMEWPAIGLSGLPVNILPTGLKPDLTESIPQLARLFENWDGTLVHRDGSVREDLRPKAGVLVHRYPHVTVGGHFAVTGTFVCYIPDRQVFFLFGDCVMNHADDPFGPFSGDPRKVLVQATAHVEEGIPATQPVAAPAPASQSIRNP